MSASGNTKLAVIGAGSVGTSLAYAALIRNSAREVVLYDVDAAKAEAEVLDLAHGTPFTGASRISGGAEIDAVADADMIVITAGAKQKPGQTRLDLAATNAGILEQLMPQLLERAPNAVFLLVTNPCDVLTVVAQQIAQLPTGRVFSSGTLLDSARLRWLIAERAGIAARSVHAHIVGEHGDTEFPLWSSARIGPTPIREWSGPDGELLFPEAVLDQISYDVVRSADRVIAGKGATNYAIGLSGARIVEAVLRNERAIMQVSSVLQNYRGINGVALSMPSIVGSGGVELVLDVPMDAAEFGHLQASADALRASATSIGY
ncbi:L-lactate dehydrogenase [Salinibacterium sp. dk2585]|uniref:L-lactate dehydrogenase n=1 Tax=unclassified Salinibacterium TaxID=2632331 RepID=UPI0011C25661|nr:MULTISPECIES: L-lactate dehydrogenase [unclassified Salinibacterium]QEE61016.1 L-lactate dehydrogenase [Salinibacterium sp. dk2585]TXK52958.1 L-lactate dehydrogenase [Salinibacterium sp. dk5596]